MIVRIHLMFIFVKSGRLNIVGMRKDIVRFLRAEHNIWGQDDLRRRSIFWRRRLGRCAWHWCNFWHHDSGRWWWWVIDVVLRRIRVKRYFRRLLFHLDGIQDGMLGDISRFALVRTQRYHFLLKSHSIRLSNFGWRMILILDWCARRYFYARRVSLLRLTVPFSPLGFGSFLAYRRFLFGARRTLNKV